MEHNEHLDEGTVHAWLDGALTPDEAAGVERHAAACNDCAALVAEARGLIAASSRILASLDDVPAAVLPASAGGEGADVAVAASHSRTRFSRPAAPRAPRLRRVAAAAAVAVVALGTAVLYESGRGRLVTDYAAPESAAESTPTAAPAQAPTVGVDEGADARQVEARRDRTAGRAAAVPEPGVQRERQQAANVPAVPPPMPRAVPSAAAPPPPAVADSSARALASVAREAAAASGRNMAADAAARPPRGDTTAQPKRLSPALSADVITRNEAQRVAGERKAALALAAPPERIVGCWALARSTAATAAGVPERFALEENVVGMAGGRPVHAARPLGAAPGDPTEWRWTIDERGEPVLLRGAGPAASRFPLTTSPAPPGERERSAARRIDCPRR